MDALERRCGHGGMTRVRIGLFHQALAHPERNGERFEGIDGKLDELRSYLYANRESVTGYAEATGTESVFRLPMWNAPSTN